MRITYDFALNRTSVYTKMASLMNRKTPRDLIQTAITIEEADNIMLTA